LQLQLLISPGACLLQQCCGLWRTEVGQLIESLAIQWNGAPRAHGSGPHPPRRRRARRWRQHTAAGDGDGARSPPGESRFGRTAGAASRRGVFRRAVRCGRRDPRRDSWASRPEEGGGDEGSLASSTARPHRGREVGRRLPASAKPPTAPAALSPHLLGSSLPCDDKRNW
jgi:hypothetical protein